MIVKEKYFVLYIPINMVILPSNFLHPPQCPSVFSSISHVWVYNFVFLPVHLTLMHCFRILPQ